MNDEFLNINVGELFFHQGSSYRKLDENRALLVKNAKTSKQEEGKAYRFYPEDEVQRISQSSTPQAEVNGFLPKPAGDSDVSP